MILIEQFRGKYFFLSNFYPDAEVEYNGHKFPNTEVAFQAAKSINKSTFKLFLDITSPHEAKKLGNNIICRKDWEEVKYEIMLDLVRQKFTKHRDLKQKLLDTDHAILQEGNWWGDVVWGVCKGVGENNLGKILMLVRDEIRNDTGGKETN